MSTTTWGNPDGTPLPMLGPTPAEKQARKDKLLAVMVGENPPAAAVQLATNRWPNYDTDPEHGRAFTVFVQGYKAALPAASGVSSPGGEAGGAALIAAERWEQINKHGFDVKNDADYGRGELVQAARATLLLYVNYTKSFPAAYTQDVATVWPWQSDFGMSFFEKIKHKPDIDKLKVAGALIAAEIDRLQAAPPAHA